MTYVKASVPKLPGGAAPVPKKDRIHIFDVDDVATDVTREHGVTNIESGNLTLSTGAKGLSIQVARASINAGYTNEGEVDAKTFKDKVEFDYPGDSIALNNFIEAYANKGVIIIVETCEGNTKIYGRVCNPMILTAEPTDSNEAVKTHLSFEQEMGDAFLPRVYGGTIPDVAADASSEGV